MKKLNIVVNKTSNTISPEYKCSDIYIYILLIYLQCLDKLEIYYLPKRSIELQHYNFCLFSKKHFSSLFLLLLLL